MMRIGCLIIGVLGLLPGCFAPDNAAPEVVVELPEVEEVVEEGDVEEPDASVAKPELDTDYWVYGESPEAFFQAWVAVQGNGETAERPGALVSTPNALSWGGAAWTLLPGYPEEQPLDSLTEERQVQLREDAAVLVWQEGSALYLVGLLVDQERVLYFQFQELADD